MQLQTKQIAAIIASILIVTSTALVVLSINFGNSGTSSDDGNSDNGDQRDSQRGTTTVTAPTNSSVWSTGNAYTIMWNSSGDVGAYVKIEYDYSYYSSSSAHAISLSTANDGSYSWTVTSNLTPRTNYLIRIASTADSGMYDDSQLFEIKSTTGVGSLVVTSPSSSSVWTAGGAYDITWTSTGEVGSSVRIEYDYSYYSSPVTIASSTSNDGSYSWSIPLDVTPRVNYLIRVSSTTSPSVYDDSPLFEIAIEGEIIVMSPSSSSSWLAGSTYSIEWSSSGAVGSYVKIEMDYSYYSSWSAVVIAGSTYNDGYYSWTIPDYTTPRTDYLIRMTSTSNPEIYDDSSFFEIRTPLTPPTLYSPYDGGMVTDTTPTLDWGTVSGATKYTIEIDDYSSFYSPLVSVEVSSSDYTVLTDLVVGGTYYWRVNSGTGDAWSDWSEVWSFTLGAASFHMSYSWSYGGLSWSMTLDVPGSIYYYYKGLERTTNYDTYVTDTDSTIMNIASLFSQKAQSQGYNSYQTVSFVMAFVQSLPYTSDSETTGYDDYARYPIETLVDNGGDCEDTAILLAAMVQADPINIDAVLFLLPYDYPTHMATGIWGTGLPGSYVTYGGRDYYYCETTGDGWSIGQLPSTFAGVSVKVVPV